MNARGRSTISDRELSAIAGEFDLTVRQLINEVGWPVATYYRRRKRLGRISADFAPILPSIRPRQAEGES